MTSHYFLDPLPESITVDGLEVPLNTDFRAVLRYDRLIQEDPGTGENIIPAFQEIFPEIPATSSIKELLEALGDFVSGGERNESEHRPSKKVLGVNSNKAMDFYIDDRRIWTAFYRTYRIDLRTIEYLHWWDFLELLEELPEDVRLEKVIHYRTVDTKSSRVGREEKKVLEAMQRYYKIRNRKSKEEELLTEALRNGADISQFL